MKFRNIITLLFTVTVFSSAYSMNDLGVSPLSQEVDPDTGVRINYISPCIFSSDYEDSQSHVIQISRSMSSLIDLQEENTVTAFKRRLSDRTKARCEYFKEKIIEFYRFLEDGFESFSIYKRISSYEEFKEYKRMEYRYWIKYLKTIHKLKSYIIKSNDLDLLLKHQLITSFDGLEEKLNFLLRDLSIVGSDSVI